MPLINIQSIILSLLFGLFITPIGGVIPAKVAEVNHDHLSLVAHEGKVYYANFPFTGIGVKYFANGLVAEKISYKKGKRNGAL